MYYDALADLIELHKRELAEKAIYKAVELKVIDDSQIETDIQGFEVSFLQIASYVRTNNVAEWREYVEQITRGQVERGVSDEGGIGIADYMMDTIYQLVEREFYGEQNKAQREKYLTRLQNMHSLGRVTILVTQIKARGNQ